MQPLYPLLLLALLITSCGGGGGNTQTSPANTTSSATSSATSTSSAKTSSSSPNNLSLWPIPEKKLITPDLHLEEDVDAILKKMSLEEKVGQIIQAEVHSISPEEVKQYHIGSVLNGGGSIVSISDPNRYAGVTDWLAKADAYYKASIDTSSGGQGIPIIWGTDAVHGDNNVIGATLFPHNIGLGAANNPELMRKIGEATAREVAATGLDWTFAPTVAVVRNDRWGRTYESYSEDPAIVKALAGEIIKGLQGAPGSPDFLSDAHIISTAKHFLGDGGTTNGIDQGNTEISEEELARIHVQGYVAAIESGVQTIMASYSSWNGTKMHGNHYLLTDILKTHMGFDGFVVGDWNGHGQVPGCSADSCAAAFNAGVDMFMAPFDWKNLYNNTLAQVKNGAISSARLDDAVRRILRVKMRAGLFKSHRWINNKDTPSTRALAGNTLLVGASDHRAIARQAVRESLVLLKNNNQVLPIKSNTKILVAGDAANSISKQAGGWSVTWQGVESSNKDYPNATSVYQAIAKAVIENNSTATLNESGIYTQKPDVAVVVFGEVPYAEMFGDLLNVDFLQTKPLELLTQLKAQGIPTISIFLSGRPLWITPELNLSDAFIAAWLPGTEGDGIADLILTDSKNKARYDFRGKLSFSWPATASQTTINKGNSDYAPLFPYGYGLSYANPTQIGDL